MPSLASEAHRNAMDGTVQEVLRQAGVQESDLEAIAVTIGPGLSMCLKVHSLPLKTAGCTGKQQGVS